MTGLQNVHIRDIRFLKKIYKQKGWESTFADDIFIHGDGCCVSESAALAFLVHEAGYKTVYVAHDSEHAWVELNGKYMTLYLQEQRIITSTIIYRIRITIVIR